MIHLSCLSIISFKSISIYSVIIYSYLYTCICYLVLLSITTITTTCLDIFQHPAYHLKISSLPNYLIIYLYLSIYQSIYLSIYLSMYLSQQYYLPYSSHTTTQSWLSSYVTFRWSGLVKEVHTYTYELLHQLLYMWIQQLSSTGALDRRRFLEHPLDRW